MKKCAQILVILTTMTTLFSRSRMFHFAFHDSNQIVGKMMFTFYYYSANAG